MPSGRALLIVNPGSRRGQAIGGEAEAELIKAGLSVQTVALDSPDQLAAAIREHAGEADLIVIAGGDGTFNCAAPALRECGRPLGIVPAGTANDLARTLGIPVDTAEACRIIARGRRHRIDLGTVNDRPFFNVAHIGFGVAVAEHHSDERKKRLGVLAYLFSVRDALRGYRPFACEITCDGRTERMRLVQLAIGNGRHYGGGLTVGDHATIDDGTLDLYAVPPLPWWRIALLLPRLKLGPRRDDPGVEVRRGREIAVRTTPALPIDTDGEITTRTPARFGVLRAAVEVFVPEDYRASTSTRPGEPDAA